jgi:hypothetical protein
MSVTIESNFHFSTGRAGQKRLKGGLKVPPKPMPKRIPRVSRLMALAIHFDGLIRQGVVRDYADLARLGGVSRARITQIMNLLNLHPKIQEQLLFLGGAARGRVTIAERNLRSLSAEVLWDSQIASF